MTREEKQSALDWVAKKNKGRGCPVCGKSAWKIQFDAGLYNLTRKNHTHVIPVICRSCGLVLLFNSIIADDPTEVDLEES